MKYIGAFDIKELNDMYTLIVWHSLGNLSNQLNLNKQCILICHQFIKSRSINLLSCLRCAAVSTQTDSAYTWFHIYMCGLYYSNFAADSNSLPTATAVEINNDHIQRLENWCCVALFVYFCIFWAHFHPLESWMAQGKLYHN